MRQLRLEAVYFRLVFLYFLLSGKRLRVNALVLDVHAIRQVLEVSLHVHQVLDRELRQFKELDELWVAHLI